MKPTVENRQVNAPSMTSHALELQALVNSYSMRSIGSNVRDAVLGVVCSHLGCIDAVGCQLGSDMVC